MCRQACEFAVDVDEASDHVAARRQRGDDGVSARDEPRPKFLDSADLVPNSFDRILWLGSAYRHNAMPT